MTDENNKKIFGGLNPTPKDGRDFSYQKVFGALDPVPNIDFMVAPVIKIEDQGSSDYCTAYAASSVSEDQEGVDLDSLYLFAKEKQISGKPEEWGEDLRTACKALTKFGCIEKSESPYTLEDGREKIAYYSNWPEDLDRKALKHLKMSYFRIDEGNDRFEAIRRCLWANRAIKQSVLTGTTWRAGWLESPSGIIPLTETDQFFGHAFKLSGQKIINGKPYLIAVLSNGDQIGDNGLFYFSKEIINRDFTFGAFVFNDMPIAEAKKIAWNWQIKMIEWFKKLWKI